MAVHGKRGKRVRVKKGREAEERGANEGRRDRRNKELLQQEQERTYEGEKKK